MPSDELKFNLSGWYPSTRATTDELAQASRQIVSVIKAMPDDQFCAFARALDGLLKCVGPSVLTAIAEAYAEAYCTSTPALTLPSEDK